MKTWGTFVVFVTCKNFKTSTRIEALGVEAAKRRALEIYADGAVVTLVMKLKKGGVR